MDRYDSRWKKVFNMTELSKMTGVPWHIEHYERQEGDPRRHRSRCEFYHKKDSSCSRRCGKCIGSAHCDEYSEILTAKVNGDSKKSIEIPTEKKPFTGVKYILMSEIEVGRKFTEHMPKEDKVQELIQYYDKYGEMDKPIVVSCYGEKYVLEDKYLRYVVAKKLGLKEVAAQIGTAKETKQIDKLRQIGTLVWDRKYEAGEVIEADMKTVCIRFDSGKEVRYDIKTCIDTGTIRIL